MQNFSRYIAFALISVGVIVLLYAVYLVGFAGTEDQGDLAAQWEREVGTPTVPKVEEPEPLRDPPQVSVESEDREPEPEPEEPVVLHSAMWFERDGEQIVNDPLYIVQGTTTADLRAGPGVYEGSVKPGEVGNLSIAGHRAQNQFMNIDHLREGDTIHVADRDGEVHVYEFHSSKVVKPQDVWVIEQDPLEIGEPTLTLTTCHPRYRNRERLIVWATLRT